jgi:PPOX class probable F420-dependent enzyme
MEIPALVRQRLEDRNFWHFVTLNRDGSATATPLWVHVDDRHILVNTAIGRRKERNVRRDRRIVLAMVDRDDPYTYAEIRGKVTEFVEGPEAEASFDQMALKYQGREAVRRAGEERVLLRIEPTFIDFRVDPGSPHTTGSDATRPDARHRV